MFFHYQLLDLSLFHTLTFSQRLIPILHHGRQQEFDNPPLAGFVRADRNPFRDAVKLTDDDPDAACRAFAALEATNPEHLSVLFNIGLCWEASKQYERAAEYYRKALSVDADHDYPQRGMSRVRSFLRGAAYVDA